MSKAPTKPVETVEPKERRRGGRMIMNALLEILAFLVELLFAPLEWGNIRAKRRKEMEDLDRRLPKDWEGMV
jgi:hypothetical protein